MQRMHALWAKLWQFIKFGIVGASNTLISLGVYELCVNVFHMQYVLSNAIGFLISVTNAYFWNSRFVFADGQKKTARQHLRGYGKSLVAYGGTFVLDTLLLMLWVEVVHTPQALAPILNLCITVPVNFLVNKFWTFKKK